MSKKNRRKLFLCIMYVGVLGYAGYTMLQQQYQLADLNETRTSLTQKIDYEKQKHEQLKIDDANAHSDEVIEKIAREKLGLIRSDEKLFVDSSCQE